MAIISVLVGLSVAVVGLANSKMAESRTKSVIKKLELALESYKVKHGYYIMQFDPYRAFYVDDPAGNKPNFCEFIDYEEMLGTGDIIVSGGRKIVIDAYGNPIEYKCPGKKNRMRFDLLSYGTDGKSPDAGSSAGTAAQGADDITNYK